MIISIKIPSPLQKTNPELLTRNKEVADDALIMHIADTDEVTFPDSDSERSGSDVNEGPSNGVQRDHIPVSNPRLVLSELRALRYTDQKLCNDSVVQKRTINRLEHEVNYLKRRGKNTPRETPKKQRRIIRIIQSTTTLEHSLLEFLTMCLKLNTTPSSCRSCA